MPILYSALIIAALYFLVRYWDKKRKKDLKAKEKKEVDRLLDLDESETTYDEGEKTLFYYQQRQFGKMDEEIPEDYYLKY